MPTVAPAARGPCNAMSAFIATTHPATHIFSMMLSMQMVFCSIPKSGQESVGENLAHPCQQWHSLHSCHPCHPCHLCHPCHPCQWHLHSSHILSSAMERRSERQDGSQILANGIPPHTLSSGSGEPGWRWQRGERRRLQARVKEQMEH